MMSKKKNIPFIWLVPLLITASLIETAGSEVYKKTNPDGTMEFYNNSEGKPAPRHTLPRTRFDPMIERISGENAVDPYLIKCIIKAESDFNPDAVSEAGAMGLMQLMQETSKYYRIRDPLDPGENLKAGIRHFKSLLSYFENDVPLALAAYHAGIGIVKKNMAVPPIDSTMRYVKKIMALYRGDGDYTGQVKILYKRIDREGTILIYSK